VLGIVEFRHIVLQVADDPALAAWLTCGRPLARRIVAENFLINMISY
jgi:hypothetical protein